MNTTKERKKEFDKYWKSSLKILEEANIKGARLGVMKNLAKDAFWGGILSEAKRQLQELKETKN